MKVKSVLDGFPVLNTFDACVDIIDVDADDDCTGNKQVDNTTTTDRVVLLTPVPGNDKDEAVLVAATAGDDNDVNGEDEQPAHYEDSEYTDDEWAAYLKIRRVQERRDREKQNEELPVVRKDNLALYGDSMQLGVQLCRA